GGPLHRGRPVRSGAGAAVRPVRRAAAAARRAVRRPGTVGVRAGDFRNRNVQLVNGRVQPYFRVAARKYRLRFVNGANERYYQLRLGEDEEMVQVASDGGLLPRPVPATR